MDGEGMQFSNMMGWTLDLNWSDKKSKDKELTPLFWNNFKVSVFRTRSFADLSRAYNMVRVIEGKIVEKWAEGKQNLLRVSGRFELPRVKLQ